MSCTGTRELFVGSSNWHEATIEGLANDDPITAVNSATAEIRDATDTLVAGSQITLAVRTALEVYGGYFPSTLGLVVGTRYDIVTSITVNGGVASVRRERAIGVQ